MRRSLPPLIYSADQLSGVAISSKRRERRPGAMCSVYNFYSDSTTLGSILNHIHKAGFLACSGDSADEPNSNERRHEKGEERGVTFGARCMHARSLSCLLSDPLPFTRPLLVARLCLRALSSSTRELGKYIRESSQTMMKSSTFFFSSN